MNDKTQAGTADKERTNILRCLLIKLCQNYFHGDPHVMALTLGLKNTDVEKALEVDGARISAAVFEEGVKYCIRKGISLDAMLADCGYECYDMVNGELRDD